MSTDQAIKRACDAGMSVSVHPTDGEEVQVCVCDGYQVISEEVDADELASTIDGLRIAFVAQRVCDFVGGTVRRWFGGGR